LCSVVFVLYVTLTSVENSISFSIKQWNESYKLEIEICLHLTFELDTRINDSQTYVLWLFKPVSKTYCKIIMFYWSLSFNWYTAPSLTIGTLNCHTLGRFLLVFLSLRKKPKTESKYCQILVDFGCLVSVSTG
jgi:hypothetical protein